MGISDRKSEKNESGSPHLPFGILTFILEMIAFSTAMHTKGRSTAIPATISALMSSKNTICSLFSFVLTSLRTYYCSDMCVMLKIHEPHGASFHSIFD